MMGARALWLAGGVASLLAHGLMLGVFALATRPEPFDPQPMPESRLDIAAYEVDRTDAVPQAATGEAAAEGDATGARTSQAAIPVSRAAPATPQAETAPATPPEAAAAARLDVAERSQILRGADAESAAIEVARPEGDMLRTERPEAENASQVSPDMGQAAAVAPASDPVEAATAQAQPAFALQPPSSTVVTAQSAPAVTTGAVPAATASLTAVPTDADALPSLAPASGPAVTARPAEPEALATAEVQVEAAVGIAPAAASLSAAQTTADALPSLAHTHGPAVTARAAEAEALATAEVRAEVATGAVPPAAILAAASPAIDTLAGFALPAGAVARAQAADALTLAVATPDAAEIAPSLASGTAVRADGAGGDIVPAAQPVSQAVERAAVSGTDLPPVAPDTPALGDRPVSDLTLAVAPLAPPAERATADLAWSGGGAENIDPVSLAAIQSFMQPGDVAASDASLGNVRDGIEAVLASVPCARLQTRFVPETGELELRGHVPEEGLRAPVQSALQALMGTAIPVNEELLILPRPQCEALAGIVAVGLPQSNAQLTNPRLVGEDFHVREYSYAEGQRLMLELTSPEYDSYVYVDYFDAAGVVFHLQPNEIVPLMRQAASTQATVGMERDDIPSLHIRIGPPFGQEIAVAFASSVPLYEDPRPIQEPAAPYLEFLRDRVAEARVTAPDFKGEWVYFFIATGPE